MSGLSKGFSDPSIASTSQECQAGVDKRTLRVTLLSSEWRSSTDGDVSTINRELAIQLAKYPSVQVSVLLPQCSEEDRRIAAYHNVHLIEAEKIPGMDPVDCLFNIPENHAMDCIIGHGVRLGRQVPVIKRQYQHCKWIQVVHTAPEELGMYKSISEVIGSGENEDFSLKGYDLAAQAIAELKDQSYQLRFICAPTGKGDETAEKLLQHGIGRSQLIVRRFRESREVLARLFCEVDLAIMPSRTEGFGLTALEALSAGLPILVSGNSGLGEALEKVPTGSTCIVDSEDPKDWAKAIRAVRKKGRHVRLEESKLLCEKYLEKYSWQEPCGFLVKKMQELVFGAPDCLPSSVEHSQLPSYVSTQTSMGPYQNQRPLQNMPTTTEKDKRPLSLHSTQPSKRLREELSDQYHQEGSSGSLPSSVEHSQWPSNVTSQTPEGPSYQRSHTQSSSGQLVGSSGHRCPPSVQYNQLSFTSVTQPSTPVYQTSYTQSPPRWLPPEYCQSPATVASHTNEGHNYLRGHTQSSYGNGLPLSSMEYNQLAFPVNTQIYEQSRSCIKSHGLSTVVDIIKAEYNRRSQLKPLLWENTIQLPIEDVYTRLKILSRRKRDFKLENNEVSMYDIYKNKDTIALVEGSPGIGKTTFCLKIAFDWANEKIPVEFLFPKFELVLLLKCRDIHGAIMKSIDEQLLPEDMYEYFRKELTDFLMDFHNQKKVLIILDGLDELPKKSESYVDRLLQKKILPLCFVLVTSRQERGITARQKVDFDILLQIEGFSNEDAFEYIRKHFGIAGPEHLATGERLIKQIEENNFLHALLNNPLNLLLLCVVFEDYQGKLPSVRTELYQIIVRCLLRRYCAKHDLEAPDDDKSLEKQFEDSLLALGELAWRCLSEDRHSFCEEELARFERSNKDLAARKLGLVFKEASLKRINPQHEYHFFHKTFQEYLAALYLAHKILKEQLNVFHDLKLHFYDHIIVDEYRQVFLFVAGILGEDAGVLFGQIGMVLKNENWDWLECSEVEASFFTECFSESRNAEQMAMSLCSFIPFPLTVDINASDADTMSSHILTVVNACKSFLQLQHPVDVTVTNVNEIDRLSDITTVVEFLASWTHLTTLSFSFGFLLNKELRDRMFEVLSENPALFPFTKLLHSIQIPTDQAEGITLAASKTSPTALFKMNNEENYVCAMTLSSRSSSDAPLTSLVLKIFDPISDTEALKKVLSNICLTSLDLIIYGDITDSQATAVGEGLATEATFKSLKLIVYGKLNSTGAIALKKGFLENTSLNSLEVKVFGEVPDNWVTLTEDLIGAKKSFMSVTFHPNATGKIPNIHLPCLHPGFVLQSLTLNLWGKLNCSRTENLCKLLVESSTTSIKLNLHGSLTDDVVDCFVRYFKSWKTSSSLSISIWGELTTDGISTLEELSNNQAYSFDFFRRGATLDGRISNMPNPITDGQSSLTPDFTNIEDTSKSNLSFNITNDDQARVLADGLAKNTLTTLSLTCNNRRDMSKAWGRGLGDGLAKNTSLTTLSLTFDSCSDLSGDWAHGLGGGLAKSTSLTTLSLTFDSCSDLSGDWAHGLGDGLAKNTSLTTLSQTFNNNDLSVDWAHGLGDGLAKNMSLTTLSLTFDSCIHLSGDWTHGLGNGLAKNTSITTLSLTFNSCIDVSGDWARGLSDGLAKNTSITALCLTFDSCRYLRGDWAHGLGDGLAINTSLTTLNLTVNNYSVMSGDWTYGLGDGLAQNTSLTTLNLTVNNYSAMRGDWTHGVGNGLAQNTSLTTLSLTVNNYSDKSGDWTHGLGDDLAKNTSLTTLSFTVNNYSDMSRDWTHGLGDGLAKNMSLTTLSLTVNNYSNLSEDWARSLGDGLAQSKSLTTLSLTFKNCSDTSGDWVNNLCDSLAKNDTVTSLSISISDLSDTRCDMRKVLAGCKSLTSLNLTVSLYVEATVCPDSVNP